MSKIDNFYTIRDKLKFSSPDEFYFVQVLQRKKDGNSGLHVRHGFRLVKSYYIYNTEELDALERRIKDLCDNNNARVYINMNVRNASECALECIKRYSDLVVSKNAFMGNNVWEKVCGGTRARGTKALWVVDVDSSSTSTLEKIVNIIRSCRHNKDFDLYTIPTLHGFHIICNGFDTKQFAILLKDNNIDEVDIHKNNPTLLYYNDISGKQEQKPIQS